MFFSSLIIFGYLGLAGSESWKGQGLLLISFVFFKILLGEERRGV